MKYTDLRGLVFFHILSPSRKLRDGRLVEPGKELKASKRFAKRNRGYSRSCECKMCCDIKEGNPVICAFGMHASHSCWDAAKYVTPQKGYWLCLVRLYGNKHHDFDKSASMRRHVIAMRQLDDDHINLGFWTDPAMGDWILAKPYKGVIVTS